MRIRSSIPRIVYKQKCSRYISSESKPAQTPKDLYPSRISPFAHMIPRKDPVVWPEHQVTHPPPRVLAASDAPPQRVLSKSQVESYEHNGFLLLPSLFDANECDGLLAEADELRNAGGNKDSKVTSDSLIVTEPGSSQVRSVFDFHLRNSSSRLAGLVKDARVLHAAQQLLGGDVYIHQARINYQQAFEGTGFSWHSDFETWHVEDGMPAMRALSCSVLLTDNNEFTGPLMVIPGSHNWFVSCVGETPDKNWEQSLKGRQYIGAPDFEIMGTLIKQRGISLCKAPRGSVIIFDCNILHASYNNLSPWQRVNLFFVYNSVSNTLRAPFHGKAPRPEHIAARSSSKVVALK